MQRMFWQILMSWLLLVPSGSGQSQTIEDGHLDLRSWNFDENPSLPLRGIWEFYWSQLYTPNDFISSIPEGRERIQVPGSWALVTDHPTFGVATYRLHVQLKEPRELALHSPWILASSQIYIDGVLIESLGRIGRQREPGTGQTYVRDDFWVFKPKQASFDIIIQVANHESMMSGFPHAPSLGTPKAIKLSYQMEIALALALIGSFMLMGIYHLCLFALRTQVRSTLYFGLACISIGLYIFGAEGSVVATFLPDIEYPTRLRLILTWMLFGPMFIYFARDLFPRYFFSQRLAHAYTALSVSVWLYFWFADITEIRWKFYVYQAISAVMILYTMVAVIRAVRNREDGAWIFALGVCVMAVTGVHDLLRAVIDSRPLFGLGLLAFIIGQSFLLARRFSKAFTDLAHSEHQIRQLNENLEALVEEKTRDIRSILDHIQLGIFAITPPGRSIHKDYSRYLQTIFKQTDFTGLDAASLLFHGSHLTSDEQSQATQALDAMLGEPSLAFELNSSALPHETHYAASDGALRVLDLTWHPVVSGHDIIEKILVTTRDVTQLRALEEKAHDREEELQFIQEILNISPEAFYRFIQNCQEFLNENRKLVNSRSIQLRDMEALKVLFINMHTLKGAARSLYLKKITRIFHDVEQYYAILQKDRDAPWDIERMNRDLDEAHDMLATYESINRNKLGRRGSDEGLVEIATPELAAFYRNIQAAASGADAKSRAAMESLQAFLFPLVFRPLQDMLNEIVQCTDALARDLRKAPPQVFIEAEGFHTETPTDNILRRIFVHILRNTMDHGIEEPSIRQMHGKSEAGTIQIRVSQDDGFVKILYQDDGQGLNLERLSVVAQSQGLIPHDAGFSDLQRADLIFRSGLSTAKQISDISGRGVGMDAVRKYLEAVGGRIHIHLLDRDARSAGRPFFFEILLPDTLFVSTPQPINAAA
ncbi:MAG TPA: 7TM diverse intracellular signaling domain-containing protein [Oligoflexus sp.]|uniref:7TM diverse intracellular signaling domain-containing protein n=1 Tax=Oligoflexus sp. TaxID=1971216 RepID=UPI002D75DFCA|nr:7TM diverse intracellular signaling domain-containing protein [Oligoflexus sp.]HYX31814.1 7TM diverse intracellular signaling domain-containing protein [Oligoflexus sp.]